MLQTTLTPEELAVVDRVVAESRGIAYKRVDTLVFEPSDDIGILAGEYVRELAAQRGPGGLGRWLLDRVVREDEPWEADWASYLLFDGEFAARLIELGRKDAHDKAEEVRGFFG